MSFMTDTNENARVGRPGKDTSRRRFLQGTTGAFGVALSPGIYKMIDTIAKPPDRPAVAGIKPIQEQYLLQNEQVINVDPQGVESSNGSVAIRVPTLYDDVITARLNVPANAKSLREAQHHLESVLQGLERQFPPTPSGMGIMVAWGLPYFQRYIPRLGKASEFFNAGTPYPRYLPIDVSTSKMEGRTVYAVQNARTFPSDQPPPGFGPVRLEENDVVVLLRSDSSANMTAAIKAIFGPGSNRAGSLFKVTSIRMGFAGGGFYGGQQSLPSKMALAAHIPGAQSIPRHSQAFLGFDTTLVSNMGPDVIANLETLPGLTNQWPNGYFKQGTTMHLSHLFEDLETWYEQDFPKYGERANAMLYPGQSPTPTPGMIALQPPGQTEAQVAQGVQKYHSYGHTGSLSVVDSTATQITSHYGEVYPAGTTLPVRGDFNTLDNPFAYTSDPRGDRYRHKPAAGLHFLAFLPTTALFNLVRLSMDGYFPGATLHVNPRSPHAGINTVLHTTHRQNYLVPPRRHRSFPLAEYLA
jgi:hypothetical protein